MDEDWIVKLAQKRIRRTVCLIKEDLNDSCLTRLDNAYRKHWPEIISD